MPSSAGVDVRRRKAANFLAGLFSVEVEVRLNSVGSLRGGVTAEHVHSASFGGDVVDQCRIAGLLFIRKFSKFVVAVRRLLFSSRRLALALVVLSLPVEPRQL